MIKERPVPYVGISGVSESKPNEIDTQQWLMDKFAEVGLDNNNNLDTRQFLLGVKAVHKTQYLDIENKYGREWYPVGEEEFAKALKPWRGISAAQIYFDSEHVADAEYRNEFMARICKRGKAWLNALQFDMLPWHEDETLLPFLENVKQETGHTIILQAHSESMQQLGPDGVAQRLGRYAHTLDYVLFDASHGKGVRMDSGALLPFLDAGYESTELADVGFGVAGGLYADVVREELPLLLEKHRSISWDAESQLHPIVSDGTRPLDFYRAGGYLETSADVLYSIGNV